MNPTGAAMLTGAIVVAGQYSTQKTMTARIGVGAVVYAIFLTVLTNVNEDLGNKFAIAILITAVFRFGPDIGYASGLVKRP